MNVLQGLILAPDGWLRGSLMHEDGLDVVVLDAQRRVRQVVVDGQADVDVLAGP